MRVNWPQLVSKQSRPGRGFLMPSHISKHYWQPSSMETASWVLSHLSIAFGVVGRIVYAIAWLESGWLISGFCCYLCKSGTIPRRARIGIIFFSENEPPYAFSPFCVFFIKRIDLSVLSCQVFTLSLWQFFSVYFFLLYPPESLIILPFNESPMIMQNVT